MECGGHAAALNVLESGGAAAAFKKAPRLESLDIRGRLHEYS